MTLIWIGMAAILLFGYGLILEPLVRNEQVPKELGGLLVLAVAPFLIWWGVRLTRKERRRTRS